MKDKPMDRWKFFDITHHEHVICNPTSDAKLSRLVELLRLPKGAEVVDIASGKGDFLFRLAKAYQVKGIGVDLSPPFIDKAKARHQAEMSDADISFLHMDGSDFKPEKPNSFALASCLGATWVFNGYQGTLEALCKIAAPGGWVIVGEPYWKQKPAKEYLEVISEHSDEAFGTHQSNAEAGAQFGLNLVYTFHSTGDEWDQYECLQWYATDNYVRENPDDPDIKALTVQVEKEKSAYLNWGRDTLGWAIYVFRR
ncbi:MAG: class I SAM-dependent methyltransferase [Pseudomonadota bacterium]